jgi:hypothetical protein
MKPFEVTVTMPGPEPALQMLLDANHWMEAWKIAMGELGLQDFDDSQVTCKIRADGAVEVIMPEFGGRRFLVATAPSPEPTTTDRPAAPDKRPVITIEELKPVKPDDTVPELEATPAVGMSHVHLYPRVAPLDGGDETNLREAVTMLASHVPAEHVLFLVPSPERTAWRVAVSRGLAGVTLDGAELSGTAPVPGPVDTAAGRRRFAQTVILSFTPPVGTPTLVHAQSALWAPVHVDSTCRGVFLAVNAPRATGFDGGEFDATQQLAELVARRMQPA